MLEDVNVPHAEISKFAIQLPEQRELPIQKHAGGVREAVKELLGDKVSIRREQTVRVTYSGSLSGENVADSQYVLLRNLVVRMLNEQGAAVDVAIGSGTIDIGDLSSEEAQALVAEDGYFGVEQTSDRIVEFAIAAAGNNPEKLALLKESVDKGFKMAAEAFGGALPEISSKTHDAIMEKLDAWADIFE